MTREEVFATRFFGTSLEWKLFFGALLLGAVLGAVYDVLRALRMTVKHHSWAVFLEDFAFMLFSGLAFYTYCTELCRGQMRFFVLAAMAAGFAAYLLTLGRLVSKTVAIVVRFAKSVISFLVKVIKKVVAVLCGVPFFQKSKDKIEENPCTDGEL